MGVFTRLGADDSPAAPARSLSVSPGTGRTKRRGCGRPPLTSPAGCSDHKRNRLRGRQLFCMFATLVRVDCLNHVARVGLLWDGGDQAGERERGAREGLACFIASEVGRLDGVGNLGLRVVRLPTTHHATSSPDNGISYRVDQSTLCHGIGWRRHAIALRRRVGLCGGA